MLTPVFKNIDSTKKFDLTNLKVLNENGEEFNPSSMSTALAGGKVKIQKLSASGAFQDEYTYYWTSSKKGWWDINGKNEVKVGDVTFENGEGMLVTSGWKTKGTDERVVYFQASGEVDLYGQNRFPFGLSLAGNSLPREIDLTEIKILNENGEEFNPSSMSTALAGGKVKIQKLSPAGAFQAEYTFYWTSSKKGWWDINGKNEVKVGDITFKAGEAFLLTNGWKTKGTDERIIYLKMPSPLDPMPVPEK